MSLMFITSEKENFKVCTTGGAKIRSQNDLKASLREKRMLAGGQIRTHAPQKE
mgnify:CR=1 FL=1